MSEAHSDVEHCDCNHDSSSQPAAALRTLSRSPRPYRRTQIPQLEPKPTEIRRWSLDEMRAEAEHENNSLGLGSSNKPSNSNLLSPQSSTPSPTHSQYWGSEPVRWAFRNQTPGGGSESGTEADDELPKKLPAPPRKLSKGLKGVSEDLGDDEEEEDIGMSREGTEDDRVRKGKRRKDTGGGSGVDSGMRRTSIVGGEGEADFGGRVRRRRKKITFVRRIIEVSLVASLMGVVLMGKRGKNGRQEVRLWREVREKWSIETTAWVTALCGTLLAYPSAIILRRMMLASRQNSEESDPDSHLEISTFIQLPRSIDPAPLLYPIFFPLTVSISISSSLFLQNLILSLASLPPRLFPSFNFQWIISLFPLLSPVIFPKSKPGVTTPAVNQVRAELLSILPPLQLYLTDALSYFLQPSLTLTEIRLLSTGLINLLISSTSPQGIILKSLLWIGGCGVMIGCSDLITWGIQLARVPRHRFRKGIEVVRDVARFRRLGKLGGYASSASADELDGGDAEDESSSYLSNKRRKKSNGVAASKGTIEFKIIDGGKNRFPVSITLSPAAVPGPSTAPPPPTQPLPLPVPSSSAARGSASLPTTSLPTTQSKRKRAHPTTSMAWYTSLTHSQARTRKFIYAIAVYTILLVLILFFIRPYLAHTAFHRADPFPWAASYLFCGLPGYSTFTSSFSSLFGYPLSPGEGWTGCDPWYNSRLEWSDTYPDLTSPDPTAPSQANRRLYISLYWFFILLIGITTVLTLSHRVEVDTRRKIFHGMVVGMFLFMGIIDPFFTHLAMSVVLAIFMIADLVRAGQLPPISKPLSEFLAPFVDGRDLKGPVVVSHFFLLVGAACAMWFSVASAWTGAKDQDQGEEGETSPQPQPPYPPPITLARELAFVAGVICVGLGDSAASLIGRRFGTWKWGWQGGKSVQGSLAFMGAVGVGLMAARAWMGWLVSPGQDGGWWGSSWGLGWGDNGEEEGRWGLDIWIKIWASAAGAAMMEAVVTGGNDNVVVPVAMWCVVKGLGL